MSSPIDPRFAVLTATPDLIDQGLVPALVEALAAADIVIVGALPHRFSAAAAAALYAGRVTHARAESRRHSGWLNPQLFTGGASLILYLRERRGDEPLVERLARLKGGSRIGEPRAGRLRNLSPLTDRGFSLVHSPDDGAGVAHELGVTLGADAIAAVVDPDRPPLPAGVVAAILPHAPLAGELNPFDIVLRTVTQIAALCLATPLRAAFADPAVRLFEHAERARIRLGGHPIDTRLDQLLWHEMAALAPFASALADAQRGQLTADLAPRDLRQMLALAQLLSVLAEAGDPAGFTVPVCDALIEALSACQIAPRGWEAHRLRLIAAYHGAEARGV